MKTFKKLTPVNQDGFAAIVIAIVLVMVLGLVTVGFAQLMRSEQKQSLDKQLSSQAYYAAESGVNLATKAVTNGYSGTKDTCQPDPSVPDLAEAQVGTETGASYPCLLIIPDPPDLKYTSIPMSESKVIQMIGTKNGSPVAVSTVSISWDDASGGKAFAPNCNTFYPASGTTPTWANGAGQAYTGVLKAQLIPVNNLSRAGFTNGTFTSFLCPNADDGGSNSLGYDYNLGTSGGSIINGNCTTSGQPRHCTANITGLGPRNQTTYFLVLRSIYSPVGVSVRLYGGDGQTTQANELKIMGAQTLIDSTGKARDVVRRIQVRVPAHDNYSIPDGTSAVTALCKQLRVYPGFGDSGANCPIPD